MSRVEGHNDNGTSGLSHELLLRLAHYDPQTGVFTSKVRRGRVHEGDELGGLHCRGYWQIAIFGKLYLAHRLALFYMNGAWPKDQVDHINGKPSDNRWVNLRECSAGENVQTTAIRNHNTSGFTGVYWNKARQLFVARITLGGKTQYLGCYARAEDAYERYLQEKASLHAFQPTPRQNHNEGSQLIPKKRIRL